MSVGILAETLKIMNHQCTTNDPPMTKEVSNADVQMPKRRDAIRYWSFAIVIPWSLLGHCWVIGGSLVISLAAAHEHFESALAQMMSGVMRLPLIPIRS